MASRLGTRNVQSSVSLTFQKLDQHIQKEHGVQLFDGSQATRFSRSALDLKVHSNLKEIHDLLNSGRSLSGMCSHKDKRVCLLISSDQNVTKNEGEKSFKMIPVQFQQKSKKAMGMTLFTIVLNPEQIIDNGIISDEDDVEVYIVHPPTCEEIKTVGAHGHVDNKQSGCYCVSHDWMTMTNLGTWAYPTPDPVLIQKIVERWDKFKKGNNSNV